MAKSRNTVALIDESRCIGCHLCVPACPLDAIVGSSQWMHTVIAAECSGCERCIAPCPVDCIEMVPHTQTVPATVLAQQFRQRAQARKQRLTAQEAAADNDEQSLLASIAAARARKRAQHK